MFTQCFCSFVYEMVVFRSNWEYICLIFLHSCCSTQHYSLSCIVTRFKPCGLTKYLVIIQYNGLFSRGKNFSDVKEIFHKWLVSPLYEAENMNFLREIIHELNPIHQIKKTSH